jgi:hypothetical protein
VNDKQATDETKPNQNEEPKSDQAPATGWQFVSDNSPKKDDKSTTEPKLLSSEAAKPVTWSAAEFIAHKKSYGWYLLLGLATVIIAGMVYIIYNRDLFSVIVIIIAAVFFGIVANRQPRTLDYKVDDVGLSIGEKLYAYDSFRSFSIIDEESASSIIFKPLKRFMPLVTVYYPPHDEKSIVNVISKHLPIDTHQLDPIDSLIRRIHY